MTKNKKIILDILLGIVVILAFIVLDGLIFGWQSWPAIYHWQAQPPEQAQQEELVPISGRVFLPILNFHHIDTAPATDSKVAQSFYIEPQKFEAILKSLLDQGYQPVFASEAVSYLQQKKMPKLKIMVITFDDGNEDFYTNAFPILQKYHVKSSMYIMTGVRGKNWLSVDQMLELRDTGLVEFGSHTIFHPYLTKISTERQIQEMTGSKKFLDDLLKKPVTILCYPFGFYNAQVEQEAQNAGYVAGLTFDQDAWQNPDKLMALTRISVYPGLDVVRFLDKLEKEK